MKKNNMLRIASVLLVAVLLSTCAISGAFAKYTTSGTAADSARVAAFGFEVEMGGNAAMFGNAYATKAGGNVVYTLANESDPDNGIANVAANTANTSVRADAKVVAPGTLGVLGSYEIDGTAEVDVMVTKNVALTLTGFDSYCPIVIFVNGNAYYVGKTVTEEGEGADGKITNVTELLSYVNVTNDTSTVHAGEAIGAAGTAAYTWEWVFDENDDRLAVGGTLAGLVIDDVKDTALGRNSASTAISMTISVTIDQID